jgi:hypothetical protein
MKRVILSLSGAWLVLLIWFAVEHYPQSERNKKNIQAAAHCVPSGTVEIVCNNKIGHFAIEDVESEEKAVFNCANDSLTRVNKTAELNKAELNIVDLRSTVQAKEKGREIVAPFCSKHPWYEGCY